MMLRKRSLAGLLAVQFLLAGCAFRVRATVPEPPPADQLAELWVEPTDIAQRDLLLGIGGLEGKPEPADRFEFIDINTSGASPGYHVRDSKGRTWSAKLGIEASPEIAVSRLLWATGFHQPAVYYLPQWTLVQNGITTPMPAARFRLEPAGAQTDGRWMWHENPFVGTDAFGGLYVLMAMVNNWDLKTSNNALYEFTTETGGAKRWYVVKDVGAAFGRSGLTGKLFGRLHGTKNKLEDFEKESLVSSVSGDKVKLHFIPGMYETVLQGTVRVSHVRWISDRLAKLSDAQWRDVFQAAGYSATDADRYAVKMKAKVSEGLKIEARGLAR